MSTQSLASMPFRRDRLTWLAYWMLAYYAFLQNGLGPAMPFLRSELGLAYTVAGLHVSAFALGMFLAGATGDRVAARLGRPRLFWGGAASMAAGALLLGLGRQPAITIGSTFVMGYGGTLLLVMIQAVLSDHHGARRAVALTESNILAMVSAGLPPLIIGAAEGNGLSWRVMVYVAMAGLLVLALGFRRTSLPLPRRGTPGATGRHGRLPPVFWAYWLVIVLAVAQEWSVIAWGADFLTSATSLSRVQAAGAMSLFFAAAVVGRTAGSRLTRHYASHSLLLTMLAVTAVGFPFLWLGTSAWMNLAGLMVTGFGVGNLFPLTMAVALDVAEDATDEASARVSMAAGLAMLVAPLTLGALADLLTITQAFGIVLALTLASFGTAWMANRMAGQGAG